MGFVFFLLKHEEVLVGLNKGLLFTLSVLLGTLGVESELLEAEAERLVLLLEVVDLGLGAGDGGKELGVSLLTAQEFLDHHLDVLDRGGRFNSFECIVNSGAIFHFTLHFLTHESVPHLLNVEGLAHL